MQSGKALAAMICTMAMAMAAPTARSDSPCYKGFRDTTSAERATMTAVLQAAKKALPPAPAGWAIEGDDQVSVIKNLCRDYEAAPWNYQFNRNYRRVDDEEARNKIIVDAAAAAAAAQKLKQPRLDAAMARIEKISARQVALIQKGDFAGAEAINDEMTKAQADYQKIADEGDSQAQMDATIARASRDRAIYIVVVVNSNQEWPDASATTLVPPPGAHAAFQWNTKHEQEIDGHALILLGQWQRTAQGSWKRVRHPEMAPSAAQVISIRITADPGRLAATIASFDFKGLATKVPN